MMIIIPWPLQITTFDSQTYRMFSKPNVLKRILQIMALTLFNKTDPRVHHVHMSDSSKDEIDLSFHRNVTYIYDLS